MPAQAAGTTVGHVVQRNDIGRCEGCGGRITATHMLTRSYPVDESGHWRRCIDEFAEDVVIVCAACGAEPEGKFEGQGEECAFVPARHHANA
jgi:hypothetical protein